MAAFTMMIMLSAALAGCINDDNSKISDMLMKCYWKVSQSG